MSATNIEYLVTVPADSPIAQEVGWFLNGVRVKAGEDAVRLVAVEETESHDYPGEYRFGTDALFANLLNFVEESAGINLDLLVDWEYGPNPATASVAVWQLLRIAVKIGDTWGTTGRTLRW